MKSRFLFTVILLAAMSAAMAQEAGKKAAGTPAWMKESSAKLEKELVAKYGEPRRPRLQRGVEAGRGVLAGGGRDAAAFEAFARASFAGDADDARRAVRRGMERALESLDGHMLEIGRDLRKQSDLDLGPIYPVRRGARRLRPVGARRPTTSSRTSSRSRCSSTSR